MQHNIVTKFEPGLYVSQAMEAIGIEAVVERVACFRGRRVANLSCGLPWVARYWRSRDPQCNISSKTQRRALRFLLGIFVVIGVFIALMFSFTPAGWTFRYNPISGTFSYKANTSHGFLQLKFFKRSTNGL